MYQGYTIAEELIVLLVQAEVKIRKSSIEHALRNELDGEHYLPPSLLSTIDTALNRGFIKEEFGYCSVTDEGAKFVLESNLMGFVEENLAKSESNLTFRKNLEKIYKREGWSLPKSMQAFPFLHRESIPVHVRAGKLMLFVVPTLILITIVLSLHYIEFVRALRYHP